MLIRRAIVGLAVSAIASLAAVSVAQAGEITPTTDENGDYIYTPISGYQAGSLCSFSGLNDDYYDPNAHDYPSTERTQSWGTGASAYAKANKGVNDVVKDELAVAGPGTGEELNCKGYPAGGGFQGP